MSDAIDHTQRRLVVFGLIMAMVAMPLLATLWMIHINVSVNKLQGARDRLAAQRERLCEARPPTVASLALAEELTFRNTISELLDELAYEQAWCDHTAFTEVQRAAERGIRGATTVELAAHLDAVIGAAVHRSRAAAGIAQGLLLSGCVGAIIGGLAVCLILRRCWLAPVALVALPAAPPIKAPVAAPASLSEERGMPPPLLLPVAPPAVFRSISSAAPARGAGSIPGQPLLADGPRTQLSGRVLVIEDNPINQRVTQRQLMELGLGVEVVDSAEIGLQRLMQSQFDVVLMDLQLPGIDGLTATRRWRACEEAEGRCRTPIIAITANATGSDREACYSAGMDGYQAKPARLGDLHRVLVRWVGPEKNLNAADEQIAEPVDEELSLRPISTPPDVPPTVDSSTWSLLLEGAAVTVLTDPQLWANLRRETSATDPRMLEELIAALRAQSEANLRELDEAFAAGQYERLRATAHRLKGSAGMLGLPRLAACAKTIEFAAKAHDGEIAARGLRAMRAAYEDTMADAAVQALV